jgi:hypothetical protein
MRIAAGIVVMGLSLLSACDGDFDGGFFEAPFPVVREVDTVKELALTVGAAPVRFAVPIRVSPPSAEARVDVAVTFAQRPLRAELVTETFIGAPPATWALVTDGAQLQSFASGSENERLRLSLARDPDDVSAPLAVRLQLRLTAPGDVDFDGLDDNVTVALDPLEPVPPDAP